MYTCRLHFSDCCHVHGVVMCMVLSCAWCCHVHGVVMCMVSSLSWYRHARILIGLLHSQVYVNNMYIHVVIIIAGNEAVLQVM